MKNAFDMTLAELKTDLTENGLRTGKNWLRRTIFSR